MSNALAELPSPEIATVDTFTAADVTTFTETLLPTLTGKEYDINQVGENLDRVLNSPTTSLLVCRDAGRIVSTATVNYCPILTGYRPWIDDVVTDPAYQGMGLSKIIMDRAEGLAAKYSHRVSLTSTPDRGPARAGYQKRGYILQNEQPAPQVVFRNSHPEESQPRIVDFTDRLRAYGDEEVEQLASLLSVNKQTILSGLRRVLGSPTSAAFVSYAYDRFAIAGVAVANTCPIPVGMKPWIYNISGPPVHARAALTASELWVAGRYEHVNIVASPEAELSENYVQRTTGLYVKPLLDTIVEAQLSS